MKKIAARKSFLPVKNELLYSTVKAPFLEDKFLVRVATSKKSLSDYFNFSIMFICFAIIGVLIGVGIFTQTKYLRKHLVRPIQALVKHRREKRLPVNLGLKSLGNLRAAK